MKVTAVVAASQNGVIGKKGGLPWRLPADLAHFRQVTKGHPVIMGRKTYESIGRPLPDRRNIIITRDNNYQAKGCTVVSSLEDALKAAEGPDEAFVIGGGSIYELAMPKTDKIVLTRVKANIEGDTRFDFDQSEWRLVKSEDHPADNENRLAFEIQEWVRR